jgi:hypothetical protein
MVSTPGIRDRKKRNMNIDLGICIMLFVLTLNIIWVGGRIIAALTYISKVLIIIADMLDKKHE